MLYFLILSVCVCCIRVVVLTALPELDGDNNNPTFLWFSELVTFYQGSAVRMVNSAGFILLVYFTVVEFVSAYYSRHQIRTRFSHIAQPTTYVVVALVCLSNEPTTE